jgi:hypothetical protein
MVVFDAPISITCRRAAVPKCLIRCEPVLSRPCTRRRFSAIVCKIVRDIVFLAELVLNAG